MTDLIVNPTPMPAPPEVGITSRPNATQFEEIELDRQDTISFQTQDEKKIDITSVFAYLENLMILEQVACIQTIERNQIFEITVKAGANIKAFSQKLFERPMILEGITLTLKSTRKLKEIVVNTTIKVVIYEAPFELKDEYLLRKLSQFGNLQKNQVFRHKYRGTEIYNGVRSVNFKKITKPIPTTMFVRGNRIRLKHDNQDRSPFCAVCKTKGHFRLECPQLLVLQRFVDLDNQPEDPSEEILTWTQARAKADEKQKQRQNQMQEKQLEELKQERLRQKEQQEALRKERQNRKRPGIDQR